MQPAESIADRAAPGGRAARPGARESARWQHCAVMRDISQGGGSSPASAKFRCGSPLDPRCAECIRRFGPFQS